MALSVPAPAVSGSTGQQRAPAGPPPTEAVVSVVGRIENPNGHIGAMLQGYRDSRSPSELAAALAAATATLFDWQKRNGELEAELRDERAKRLEAVENYYNARESANVAKATGPLTGRIGDLRTLLSNVGGIVCGLGLGLGFSSHWGAKEIVISAVGFVLMFVPYTLLGSDKK